MHKDPLFTVTEQRLGFCIKIAQIPASHNLALFRTTSISFFCITKLTFEVIYTLYRNKPICSYENETNTTNNAAEINMKMYDTGKYPKQPIW